MLRSLLFLTPTSGYRFCNFGTMRCTKFLFARFAAFATQGYRRRVFPPLIRRRRPVLNLPSLDVDNQLTGLVGVAGAYFHFKSKATSTRHQRQN
jgi:hypothetical protein